jgi:2-polyprenyl-3-methyl-5-hydroxy-6-metoxy-1,4-benzoquinol methylase
VTDLTAMLKGRQELGLMTGHRWQTDPKGLLFTLSRYKAVAKMVEGVESCLEVGCGDAFPARIVRQHVGELVCVDVDERLVDDARLLYNPDWTIRYGVWDMLRGPFYRDEEHGRFDVAYSLDVLEHIEPKDEHRFLGNMAESINEFAVIGMPSIESQEYASELSKLGHVNCKTAKDLKKAMLYHFRGVLVFGMNDEVLHTGYDRMRQYLIAVGWK